MSKRALALIFFLIAVSIPLTSCNAIAARVRPTPRPTPAPKAGAKPVASKPSPLEDEVKGVANKLGFASYQWQLFELPSNEAWDNIFAYYNSDMQSKGWIGDGSKFVDAQGHQAGSWIETETKSGLVIIFVPGSGGTPPYALIIFGQPPEEPGG